MSPHLHPADAGTDARSRLEEGADALARSKDELANEFRALIGEGERLVRSTTHLSAEALAQARESFRVKLSTAKERLGEMSTRAGEQGRQAAIATDEFVHVSPWTAVGVAAGVGFALAVVLSRRSA